MFKNYSLTTRVTTILVSITLLVFVGICLGGWFLFKEITTSPFRKALPATAEEVHEWSWNEPGPLSQDFSYMLAARISNQDFMNYVDQFDLSPYDQQMDVNAPSWSSGQQLNDDILDWWTPTESTEGTYVYATGSYWIYAKHENGYLFLYAYNI
ncbi:hypothetical protein [Candidatus Leptofilum sp.]|uniref:hypothetical protein n=1 Tax=Candidatus Leptofilum sp. TaxID=3241576 RepID=UPI003B5CF0D5